MNEAKICADDFGRRFRGKRISPLPEGKNKAARKTIPAKSRNVCRHI